MNYWHMNLHPTGEQGSNDDIKKIILGRTIGMGFSDDSESKGQMNAFKDQMKVGDIVVIVNGQTPIALVEVIGDWYEFYDENSIIWFHLRRAVKILNLKESFAQDFPMRTKTLTISIGEQTKTYKFIESWHKESVC